jgi:hypothetical protein
MRDMGFYAIAVDWHGPFLLEHAVQQIRERNLSDGVYIAFGRYKGAALWPLWWESRWVASKQPSTSMTTRLVRYPIQYVGEASDIGKRIAGHETLGLLSSKKSWIWVGTLASEAPQERDGRGILKTVSALEKVLIFSLRPRQNDTGIDKALSVSEFSSWCRVKEKSKLTKSIDALRNRLPEVLRRDPHDGLVIDFGGKRSRRIQIDADAEIIPPVLGLKVRNARRKKLARRATAWINAVVFRRHGFGKRGPAGESMVARVQPMDEIHIGSAQALC